MRNATSIGIFGASALALTLIGACGGSGGGTRAGDAGSPGASGATTVAGSTGTSGSSTGTSGSSTGTSGNATGGGSAGGAASCTMAVGAKHGDGATLPIDDLDDTNTMFTPPGMGAGSWDLSKDAMGMGTMVPATTAALLPMAPGHGATGNALHLTGTGLTGWGAALAAFLNGPMGAYDASSYGGVAFWIKGTTTVQEGTNKLMVQFPMPDVVPGVGSCCDDKVIGKECYSGHRVVIDVPTDWQEVRIAWSDLKPASFGLGSTIMFDPNRLRAIEFSFNHDAASTTTTTSFDFTVDGLRFITKTEMSNVGTGAGGTSSGGTSSGGTSSGGGGMGGGGMGGGGMGGASGNAGTGGV